MNTRKFNHTLLWRGYLIHSSVNIHLPAATIQISVIPWLAVHINCQYHPDHCWQGWFCFRALPMIKTKSFFYKCHENTYFVIRQVSEASSTSTKPIQKQSFSSGSVIPTGSWRESYSTMHSLSGYSTTDRIKPSGYSSLLFRWLFHNAFILKVAQRMGMKIQSYTLSHNNHKQVPSRQVPLHKREDDERVWLRWNN